MREEKIIHGILFYRHRQQPVYGQAFFRRTHQHPPGDAGDAAPVQVDYIASILMVDNYLPAFDMAEQMGMDKHVEEQLSAAVQAVSRRERGIPEATEEGRRLHAQVAA